MVARRKRIGNILNGQSLYNSREFNCICDYEKLRSDRSGLKFAHITFDLNLENINIHFLRSVLKGILHQLRATDHIGWSEIGQIYIILAGTDEKGARGFLENISHLVSGSIGISLEEILIYPDQDNMMKALAISSPVSDETRSPDPEDVAVIPFEIAE